MTGAIKMRRCCESCRQRRRCFLVVEMLTFTTAWLCGRACLADALRRPELVRLVLVKETTP